MQLTTQQTVQAMRRIGSLYVLVIGGIVLAVAAGIVATSGSPASDTRSEVTATTPAFVDEMAYRAAWWQPYPGEATAAAVTSPSILEDEMAFRTAWFQPYPAETTPTVAVTAPSILDDEMAFRDAWFQPYP